MKKLLLLVGIMSLLCLGADRGESQTGEYKTITLSGVNDVIIDSTLTTALMNNKRVYINGIYYWWDNAANTNPFYIEIVRGQSALVTAGSQRAFRFSEAMTSGGVKGSTIPVNLTSGTDSTLYFVVSATSSDSLFVSFNYRIVGN